jgi:hypothetical protein
MGTTYEACGDDVHKLVAKAMGEWHLELKASGVTIDAVFARKLDSDENPVPAVTAHGSTAAAKIGITSLEDRARGLKDAKLTIDGHVWDGLSAQSRIALIDHELEHLNAGEERDDLGRPKLKMSKHDYVLAGFLSIINRHGQNAIEHREMTRFQGEHGQLFLPGIGDGKGDKANG